MNEKYFLKLRVYFTALVTIAIGSLLAWNHFHGGVPSHHILAKKELPEISNWWGGLLLPLLTWFLLYRVKKRIFHNPVGNSEPSKSVKSAIYAFVGSFSYGILFSVFFAFDYRNVTSYMILAPIPLALFFPVYRAENMLGFVIGMTVTFGAVLPTAISSILALVCAVVYLYVRPAIAFVAARVVRM